MVDRDGNPVHALFGFARMLGDLIERARPKLHRRGVRPERAREVLPQPHLPAPTRRTASRRPRTCSCRWSAAGSSAGASASPAFGSAEYEADDIIGTLACTDAARGRARHASSRATRISRSSSARATCTGISAAAISCGYHDIERRFGVAPERFADYLALTGDAVDNIKGVPGIGPKTAATLMKHFASLDELYGDLDRVSEHEDARCGGDWRAAARASRGGVSRAAAHGHRLRHAARSGRGRLRRRCRT